MLAIFSDIRSNRFKFILDFICTTHIKCNYTLYTHTEEYNLAKGTKINYSNRNLSGFHIKPSSTIWDSGVDLEFKPNYGYIKDVFVQFTQNSALGFDPFAMAFYNISRYKEYQTHKKDKHGRYMAENDLIDTVAIYHKPYLDIALDTFCLALGITAAHKYSSMPTVDIDMAYMYAGKVAPRRINSWLRDPHKWGNIARLFINQPNTDPYYLNPEQINKANTHVFYLYGEYGMYDKNIRTGYTAFKKHIAHMAQKFEVGLHPSYLGNELEDKWQIEKKALEKVTGKTILKSRQHYIMMQFAGETCTYAELLKLGITHDYSMGFTDDVGYRAGTALPFYWFNLHSNEPTKLKVHPFVFMDVVLKNTLKYSYQQALERIQLLKTDCLKWNLPFCGVFHNESLSNYGIWQGWDTIFEEVF